MQRWECKAPFIPLTGAVWSGLAEDAGRTQVENWWQPLENLLQKLGQII